IDFQIEMTRLSDECEYRKVEVLGTDLIKVKKAIASSTVKKNCIAPDDATWSRRIYFKKINASDSESLLRQLGATDLPEVKRGFKMKNRLNFDQPKDIKGRFIGEARNQIHFSFDKYDGLAFHLDIKCKSY